jgi:hypothetical protein
MPAGALSRRTEEGETMKRMLKPALMLALALGLATTTLAAQAQKTTKAQPTHHTAKGTIEAYDAATHSLTLKAAKGPEAFDVTSAKVWSGSKSVGLEQLVGSAGSEASVNYTMKEGKRHASSVHVAAAAASKPAAK